MSTAPETARGPSQPSPATGAYETVIGLEIHVQLNTRSKMFCSCAADYQWAEPNTRVCPVCLALPGALPIVNRRAVESAMMIGLALNCRVAERTKFDRKNYPYPDLMKGYQISQFDMPICSKGQVELTAEDGTAHVVGINRVHMEEDVAKLMHIAGADGGPGHTLMDVNRAGVPLMEIVSEPDIRSPQQAEHYITTLQQIIRYLGVGTANMEEGSFRCDANVSIRPAGSKKLGSKVEVKNMNRVRAVTRALEYEIARQTSVLQKGGRVVQETRGWDDGKGVTVPQRSKEEAHDYRYFPEPDIPPLLITAQWVDGVRSQLPELPLARNQRFQEQWGLSAYDAGILTASRSMADYFEGVTAFVTQTAPEHRTAFAKEVANWLIGETSRLLNESGTTIADVRIKPTDMASLVDRFRRREINNATTKTILEEMFRTGESPDEIIKRKGLTSVADVQTLGPIVEQVIAANPAAVTDYRSGKETALRFLIGQVMKSTKGQAEPARTAELLKERLSSR